MKRSSKELGLLGCVFFIPTKRMKEVLFLMSKYKKGEKNPECQSHMGQHLLHNKSIIKKIVSSANIKPHELVVEIGPGSGALTLPLSEKANYVLAIEKDATFVRELRRKMKGINNLKVIHGDFLHFLLPKQSYVVVASIPYGITTPILRKLLNQPANPMDRAVLVIEKGAAKRFTTSRPTNPEVLKWRMWFRFTMGQQIGSYCFSPPPSVESVVFKIKRRQELLIPFKYHKDFMGFAAYALRFPQLPIRYALKGIFTAPQITRLLRDLKVEPFVPIYSLTEKEWAKAFMTMVEYVPDYRWPKRK